ncbi:MAG: FtsW/RodA/SpoVE family cell cycle protein [Oscillospiraceae bacterium]|nr:FtsW/RodA/SpoVE family cell cycle protein [Oscillospiraceae bacterium]
MNTFKRAWRLFWGRIDWLLLLPCIGLSVFSLVLLTGLHRSEWLGTLRLNSRNITMQGISLAVGIVIAIILANMNYRAITRYWKLYVPVFYVIFLATFIFGVGPEASSHIKRWLIIPGINMSIQPSEFLKLAFILSFAYHVHRTQDRFNHPLNIAFLCVHAFIPVMLVQLQKDGGTALMFFIIFLAMMFVAGIKWVYMAVAAIGIPAMIPVVWMYILTDTQKNRILGMLGQVPTEGIDPTYQPKLAAEAIAKGGMFGNGIFNPTPAYVPEMHNDFIFAFIANALGFVGCAAVILVIALIGAKMLVNCGFANDKQGQVICAGVFAMIFGQSVLNICMTLSLLPVIGNSLPFLSSGGSFVLANFLGVGMVMSVYKHTKRRQKVESFLPKPEQRVI